MTDLVWQSLAAGSLSPETVEDVTALNTLTAAQGLTLTEAQAAELVAARREALVQTGRVEFGSGVTEKLIRAFYTSPYLTKETYAETLQALTELFYQLKNETDDRVGDDALLAEMRARFDGDCGGSLDLFAGDAMPAFVRDLHAKTEDADA